MRHGHNANDDRDDAYCGSRWRPRRLAAAADLAEQGHEICLWRRDAGALAPLLDNPTITLKDFNGRREVRIAQVSTDIGTAVRGADLILMPVPAFAQIDIATAVAPHVTDGQVVFLPPGTFGSF